MAIWENDFHAAKEPNRIFRNEKNIYTPWYKKGDELKGGLDTVGERFSELENTTEENSQHAES